MPRPTLQAPVAGAAMLRPSRMDLSKVLRAIIRRQDLPLSSDQKRPVQAVATRGLRTASKLKIRRSEVLPHPKVSCRTLLNARRRVVVSANTLGRAHSVPLQLLQPQLSHPRQCIQASYQLSDRRNRASQCLRVGCSICPIWQQTAQLAQPTCSKGKA
jgi:hypothetical protein